MNPLENRPRATRLRYLAAVCRRNAELDRVEIAALLDDPVAIAAGLNQLDRAVTRLECQIRGHLHSAALLDAQAETAEQAFNEIVSGEAA